MVNRRHGRYEEKSPPILDNKKKRELLLHALKLLMSAVTKYIIWKITK